MRVNLQFRSSRADRKDVGHWFLLDAFAGFAYRPSVPRYSM